MLRGIPYPTREAEPRTIYLDESGRGCLAGPMMAGAVIVTTAPEGAVQLHDGKLLTKRRRRMAAEAIAADSGLTCAVASVSAAQIDRLGLAAAWTKLLRTAVAEVDDGTGKWQVVVDGNVATLGLPADRFTVRAVVRADQKHYGAAAAGILAKEVHDDTLRSLVQQQVSPTSPFYAILTSGKGYWHSQQHADLLTAGRCTSLHRHSFRPLRQEYQ